MERKGSQAATIDILEEARKGTVCRIGEPVSWMADDAVSTYRELLASARVPQGDIERQCTKVNGVLHANHEPNARVNRRGFLGIIGSLKVGLLSRRNIDEAETVTIPVGPEETVFERRRS